MRRAAVTGFLCAALLGCGGTAGLRGQAPASAPSEEVLVRAERALDAGRVEEARRELAPWLDGREAPSPRARYLRARLTEDGASAREEYLWVAVDGDPDYAPRAWLRLAQLDLLEGAPERALEELERLRSDYPNSARVPESWLWTGLALEASGDLPGACRAWERAAAGPDRAGDREVAARARSARTACEGGLRVAVQLGAFESESAARRLGERAVEAEFEARVERIDGLWRVRVGRFAAAESARRTAERLRRAGFSAVIVTLGGGGEDGP